MASMPKILVDGIRFKTADGKPFVPFGVNYFRPGTGWAPQVWKQFDADAIRRDFAILKFLGVSCVRVFISFGSFYNEPGKLMDEGLAKFDRFLEIAEEQGIYIHPTGPDAWEGMPKWAWPDRYADEDVLVAMEQYWKQFAARYKGRNVIFAYDLLNEPHIRWNTPAMQTRWNAWAKDRHGTTTKAAAAWGIDPSAIKQDTFPIPPNQDKLLDPMLLDFHRCRETIADEWTRRQAAAIKSADRDALVTVGNIQWAIPAVISSPEGYAAFRPMRQAKYLDFIEVHFYPLEHGAYEYGNAEQEKRNLSYVEICAVESAKLQKPLVIAEFGWHGGGTFPMGNAQSKPGTEQDQEKWCTSLIRTTEGLACGWLNWGFYDHPQAKDVSVHTGLLTPDGKPKAWSTAFKRLAEYFRARAIPPAKLAPRPDLPWDKCITSRKAGQEFRDEYLKAFLADKKW